MNKALTTMMMAAFSVTCLTAAAQENTQPYSLPEPGKPLVIWGGEKSTYTHEFSSDWQNKLALKYEGAWEWFLNYDFEKSSGHNYYIQCLDENDNVYSGNLQIGTSIGYWGTDGKYVEKNIERGEDPNKQYLWFNTLRSGQYDDVLITNQFAYDLRRRGTVEVNGHTLGRNLQFNEGSGKIKTIQIVAKEATPVEAAKNYKEVTVYAFNGSTEATTDIEIESGSSNDSYYAFNPGDYKVTLTFTGDFMKGLGLNVGDYIAFGYNWFADGEWPGQVKIKYEGFETVTEDKGYRIYVTDKNKNDIEKGISITGKKCKVNALIKGYVSEEVNPNLIEIFVPGKYPETYKDQWGTKNFYGLHDGTNGREELRHFGTGVINPGESNLAFGQVTHSVYSFYDEWWTKDLCDEDLFELTENNGYQKNSRQRILPYIYGYDQTEDKKYTSTYAQESWPLELRNVDIPNLSRVKLGDKLVIDFTARGLEKDVHSIFNCQMNMGTYDPAQYKPEDARAGYTDLKATDGEKFHEYADGHYTLEFVVTPELLEYITRWGLTINGRNYDINSIKAIVAEENKEKTQHTKEEYFYNTNMKPAVETTQTLAADYVSTDISLPADFNEKGQIVIVFLPDKKFNEIVTHYYDDAEFENWKNSISDFSKQGDHTTHDGFKASLEKTSFEAAIRYYDSDSKRWERLHIESSLKDDHFTPTQVTNAPMRAAGNSKYDSTSSFVNGVESAISYKYNGNNILVMNVKDGSDLKNSIAANGLRVRGKLYQLSTDHIYTGIEDVVEGDNDAPVEIYTLQGIRVSEMTPGNIYIVKQGNKINKVNI